MTLHSEHPLVVTALDIATRAHGTQAVNRLIRVASRLTDPHDQVVALLHAVTGETTMTGATLYDDGIPVELIMDVAALTRKPGEPYKMFLNRVHANGPRPVRVKAAVVADRLDPAVLATLPVEEQARILAAHALNVAMLTARTAA